MSKFAILMSILVLILIALFVGLQEPDIVAQSDTSQFVLTDTINKGAINASAANTVYPIIAVGTQFGVYILDEDLRQQSFIESASINTLQWSPNGEYLMAETSTDLATNSNVFIWQYDQVSQALIKLTHFYGTSDDGHLVAWSPNSNQISNIRDQSINIIQLNPYSVLYNWTTDSHGTSIEWVKNGSQIITSHADSTIRLWDAASGNLLDSLQIEGFLRNADWNETYDVLSVLGENATYIIELDPLQILATVQGDTARSSTWIGKQIAIGTYNGEIMLYSPNIDGTAYALHTTFTENLEQVLNLSPMYNHNTDWRLVGSGLSNAVYIWEQGSSMATNTYTGDARSILAMDISEPQEHLLTIEEDDEVVVWDLSTTEMITRIDMEMSIGFSQGFLAKWGPTGNQFAIGIRPSTIEIYDLSTNQSVHFFEHNSNINDFIFSSTILGNLLIASGDSRDILIWDTDTGQLLETITVDAFTDRGSANRMKLDPSGKYLAVENRENSTLVYDLTNANEPVYQGEGRIFAWEPSGNHIAIASQDTISVIDIYTWTTIRVYQIHPFNISQVVWTPQGSVITLDGLGNVYVSDPTTGIQIETIVNEPIHPPYRIVSIIGSPTSEILVGRNSLDKVLIWDRLSPPASPSSLNIPSQFSNEITLEWNDSQLDVDGYILERSTDGGTNWESAATIMPDTPRYDVSGNTHTYIDVGLTCGNSYMYRIRAFLDTAPRLESDPRGHTDPDTVSVVCGPTPPSDLMLSVTLPEMSDPTIELNWTDNSTDELGFLVQRQVVESGEVQEWRNVAETVSDVQTITDTDFGSIDRNEPITYRVLAFSNDAGGTRIYSSPINIVSTYLFNEPSNINATFDNTTASIAITVDPNASDGSAAPSNIQIERSTDGGASWLNVYDGGLQASYADTNSLSCETAYVYRARTYRDDGQVPLSYSPYSEVSTPISFLCTPDNLQASVSGNLVDLSWTYPGTANVEYLIERREGTDQWVVLDLGGEQPTTPLTAIQDTLSSCDSTYEYRVQAQDLASGGISAYSSVVSATIPCSIPPLAPNSVVGFYSPGFIDIDWLDNATDETAFHIERAPDDGTGNPGIFAEIGTVPADTTSFTDTESLACGMYYYRVRAFRADDGLFSDYSNMASVEIPCDPPSSDLILTDGIYRAVQRDGDPRVYIERSMAAGLDSFDSNPVDSWTLMGRTNGAGDNGELQAFTVIDNVPYAAIQHANKGCIVVTPVSLDERRRGQTRLVTIVEEDVDVRCDGEFHLTAVYRAVQNDGDPRVYIERNMAAGLDGFDSPPTDGWTLIGRTNGAGDNGELQAFVVINEIPYAAIQHSSKGCIVVTPVSLDERRRGQTRLVTIVEEGVDARCAGNFDTFMP